MNPNTPQPSFELPTPQPAPGQEQAANSAEAIPARPEAAPNAQPSGVQGTVPAAPAAGFVPSAPASPVPLPAQPAATPVAADDNDLIEKEWVEKAKQIVAATREDPYAQTKEMSRFKADYLKKRYNKDIKLEET